MTGAGELDCELLLEELELLCDDEPELSCEVALDATCEVEFEFEFEASLDAELLPEPAASA